MKQKIVFVTFLGAFLLSGSVFISCAEKSFTKINRCQDFYKPCINKNGMDRFRYSFKVEGQVRIEFLMDNSGSMAEENKKVAHRFNDLRLQLDGLKWRAGISTTDVDNENRILMNGQSFIDWNTVNPISTFTQAIQRTESIQCGDTRVAQEGMASFKKQKNRVYNDACPSGKESGIKTARKLVKNGRSFAISQGVGEVAPWTFVMISDEDDHNVYQQYKSESPSERNEIVKKQVADFEGELNQSLKGIPWIWHSLIIRPGDEGCLDEQNRQGNDRTLGRYGHFYSELSQRTGGKVIDICQPNYGSALRDIGKDIAAKLNTIAIACQQPENLRVNIKDGDRIHVIDESDYTINNKIVEFDESILGVGNTVNLEYKCPELI